MRCVDLARLSNMGDSYMRWVDLARLFNLADSYEN